MTTREQTEELAALGIDLERLERAFIRAERNDEYFRAHQWELFDLFRDKIVLVHSGGIVETFDDTYEMARRFRDLDQDVAEGAITRRFREGIWIL